MNRAKLNYFIDVGLGLSFLISLVTGIRKFPIIVKLLRHRSMDYFLISRLHDWSGIVMGVLVIIHIILHWNWIVCMTKSIFKRQGAKKCKD